MYKPGFGKPVYGPIDPMVLPVIERGVPLRRPPQTLAGLIRSMTVGQSVIVEDFRRASFTKVGAKTGARFEARKIADMPHKIRVWRVA